MSDKAIIIESTKNMLRATKLFSDADLALFDQMGSATDSVVVSITDSEIIEKPLVTIKDIQSIFNLSDSTVRNLIAKGILKPVRGFKKPFRFNITDVKKAMHNEPNEKYKRHRRSA